MVLGNRGGDTIKAIASTDMYRTFIPAITPLAVQSQPSWWFAFVGNKLLICPEGKVS